MEYTLVPKSETQNITILTFASKSCGPSLCSQQTFTHLQYSGLPRSMPNVDQCRSMPIKILALIPMLINSDQCRSMPINSSQCRSMPINARLIGIDRH